MPNLPSGTVTFLFTDIEGSTERWEQDREAMAAAVERHIALLDAAIQAHGGVHFKTVGDAVQAVFPTAPGAVGAALDAQRSLVAEDWGALRPLRVRMALHAGEATPDDHGDYLAAPLNRLARLLASAHGGQILLTQTVQQLTRRNLPAGATIDDLGEHHLRDLLEPERVFQLLHPDLPSDFPPLQALEARPHNLPLQSTPFLGREREVAEIGAVLRRPEIRLLTLTGPGGTGKTRLALQVAAELLDHFIDGIFVALLASVTDPHLVPSAMATALGLREEGGQPLRERLIAFLAAKELLLVLDNVEHLVEAAPLVAELLAAAPGLKVLATSRVPLKLRAEHEYPVPPLALPPRHLARPEQLAQYEAVRFFIARAQAVQPDFTITTENAHAITEISYRLDGLPLAIELAAVRIRMLPPQALLSRMEQRLPLLTGGARDAPARQRTLRDTIAWSYHLLEPADQLLFRRLAVFVGGATLEVVERVATMDGDLDVFGGLERLLEHNLVRQEQGADGAPRYRMLETIREFAGEELAACGENEAVRRRHTEFYLALVEASVDGLRSADMAHWTMRLEADHDNLRAAMAWAIERSHGALALRFVAALRIFWLQHAHHAEARSWLARALAFHDDPSARVAALFAAAVFEGDDPQRAHTLAEEALHLARTHGDALGAVRALAELGNVAAGRGDAERAQALLGEALTLAEHEGDVRWMGSIAADLGYVAIDRGELDEAQTRFQSALAQFRQVGYAWNEANMFGALSEVARLRGDQEQATELLHHSLARHHALNSRWGMLGAIEGLAALATVAEPVRAIHLYGAAVALRDAVGARLPPAEQAHRDRDIAELRSRVGEAQFLEAWGAGHARPWAEVVAEVLGVTSDSGATTAHAARATC